MSRQPKHTKKLKRPQMRRAKRQLIGLITFVFVFGAIGSYLLFPSFAATQPAITPDPNIVQGCDTGLNIALVADVSGSLIPYLGDVRTAYLDFVSGLLPATKSQFSLTEFDSNATLMQRFTNSVPALDNAIDSLGGGSSTNWTDGLTTGYSTFAGLKSTAPKILVIATDGDPNQPGVVAEAVVIMAEVVVAMRRQLMLLW
jgi:hypothetical protein